MLRFLIISLCVDVNIQFFLLPREELITKCLKANVTDYGRTKLWMPLNYGGDQTQKKTSYCKIIVFYGGLWKTKIL